jgi:hypothetical protein
MAAGAIVAMAVGAIATMAAGAIVTMAVGANNQIIIINYSLLITN